MLTIIRLMAAAAVLGVTKAAYATMVMGSFAGAHAASMARAGSARLGRTSAKLPSPERAATTPIF